MIKRKSRPPSESKAANLRAYRSAHENREELKPPVLKNIVEKKQVIDNPINKNYRPFISSSANPLTLTEAFSQDSIPSMDKHAREVLLSVQANAVKELETSINQHLQNFEPMAIEDIRAITTKTNLLVQNIVDNYVPIIEDALRKRLQEEMNRLLIAHTSQIE